MISLNISQRETDAALEALGLKKGRSASTTGSSGSSGRGPRRIFIGALITAVAGLVATQLGAAAKAAGDAVLGAVHAELALHRTVAAHSRTLEEHTQELADQGARLQALQVQAPLPPQVAARLVKLLEDDVRAREASKRR